MSDSIETNYDSIVEACEHINQQDAIAAKGSFVGLLQDAPGGATSVLNALSQQLIYQLQIILPDTFVDFSDLNVELGNASFSYVQAPGKQALQRAINERGIPMQINSAYRTLAQQMLLYNGRFDNPNPVAKPGRSNHQTGLAIDIDDPRGWEPFLTNHGWEPLGGDPPHFDYQGGGTIDVRSKSILAFQQLWNKNNPNDQIDEDGGFGSQTEDALNRSPANGFAKAPWDDRPRILKLTTPRMEGSDVTKLQEALKKSGIEIVADGEFGPGTDKALKEHQLKSGLVADGVAGPKTIATLA
jgi:N-acetylmuramoyl-L-alanine amidase